jgi:saccharopine dehydrogenase-like NADP-dependent oxidoreductase
MKLLLRDLRLGERRELLKDVLETALPMTWQDVVLVFVTVGGWREGQLVQESYANNGGEIQGRQLSAIQLTTAAGVCAMVDLLLAGRLPQRGFVRQEEARLDEFLANRFGRYLA